ncbi:MAG: phosphate/phosphite/phosphonate ABC transporter substrate-binding protein [Chloroflexota bacterium]
MTLIRVVITFILTILLAAACARSDTDSAKRATGPGKGAKEKPLLIGLPPEYKIFDQVARYQPLADYLSARIGRKIVVAALPRYGNIIDDFASMQMDGAFFGSFAYVLACHKMRLEVLARPESADGISTYHGLIFVKKNSGIRYAKDMRGKRFAFVDKATTAGYLLPLEYFKKAEIKDYRRYLKENYFAGSHEDAIYDVLNGKADIGAAKNTVFDKLAKTDKRIKSELTIIERSPDVPENALAVRKDLDPALKNRLREALLTMHDDPEGRKVLEDFGARKFIATADNDYEPVNRYVNAIGLDLATYDYRNN